MSFLVNPFRFAVGGGAEAFPVVESTATSTGQFVKTQTVTMPSGVVSGDLLIILFGCNQSATTPSGWSLLDSLDRTSIFSKVSDGTEGASVSITLSTNGFGVHNTYRISGHNGLAGVEVAIAEEDGGGPISVPSLTPSWGSAKTLWLAWMRENTDGTITSAPTDYTDLITATNSGGQTTRSHCGSARRELEATSDDPDSFGGQETQEKEAALVAIQPTP